MLVFAYRYPPRARRRLVRSLCVCAVGPSSFRHPCATVVDTIRLFALVGIPCWPLDGGLLLGYPYGIIIDSTGRPRPSGKRRDPRKGSSGGGAALDDGIALRTPAGATPARGSQWFDWLFLSAAVISIAGLISPKVEIAVGQGKKRIAR